MTKNWMAKAKLNIVLRDNTVQSDLSTARTKPSVFRENKQKYKYYNAGREVKIANQDFIETDQALTFVKDQQIGLKNSDVDLDTDVPRISRQLSNEIKTLNHLAN